MRRWTDPENDGYRIAAGAPSPDGRRTVVVAFAGNRAGRWCCRSLRDAGFRVVGAEDGAAGKPRWCDDFLRLPSIVESPDAFRARLEDICRREAAVAVMPNDHEGATQLLSAAGALGGAVAVAPTPEQYEALCDKLGLTATAAAAGIDRPQVVVVTSGTEPPPAPAAPCIVKPARTDTWFEERVVRRVAVLARDDASRQAAIEDIVGATGSALVEEQIVGRSWRVHFVAAREGFAAVPVITLRSYPRAAGMSTIQTVPGEVSDDVLGAARRLIEHAGYIGPGSVQFIERDGRYYVHDVNLRLPSSVGLSIRGGLDMPRLGLGAVLGEPLSLPARFRAGATYYWLGGEARGLAEDLRSSAGLAPVVRFGREMLGAALRPGYVLDAAPLDRPLALLSRRR